MRTVPNSSLIGHDKIRCSQPIIANQPYFLRGCSGSDSTLRPSALPYRVQFAGRGHPPARSHAARPGTGHGYRGHDRPRQHVRSHPLPTCSPKGGDQARHRLRGLRGPGDRRDKEHRPGHIVANHLVLLAKDLTGYQNLVRLVSAGFTEASTTSRASTWSCCASTTRGSSP